MEKDEKAWCSDNEARLFSGGKCVTLCVRCAENVKLRFLIPSTVRPDPVEGQTKARNEFCGMWGVNHGVWLVFRHHG